VTRLWPSVVVAAENFGTVNPASYSTQTVQMSQACTTLHIYALKKRIT
jgi:hypothetical protein